LKQQEKACFENKAGPRKTSLALLFEDIDELKSQLKPQKTATSNKKRNKEAESILSTEIYESTQPLVVMTVNIRSTF
jgi:hypothetical protein